LSKLSLTFQQVVVSGIVIVQPGGVKIPVFKGLFLSTGLWNILLVASLYIIPRFQDMNIPCFYSQRIPPELII
jgi:hypothetical protein